jgi:3-oxoacyl-[acyl-carrier protein] reductase
MSTTPGARFEGKVALVTGGGSGIGAAVVRQLDAEGCAVVVVADLDEKGAVEVAASCRSGDARPVDVADAADVDRLLDAVLSQHGQLDVVVHAAGVDDPESKAAMSACREAGEPLDVLRQTTDSTWRRLMAVNLDGTFHVLRASARAMVPRRTGAIVTVGSSAAFDTLTGYGPYAASKAGAQALSQAAAKELAPFGIRVNVVAPGPVDTPMAGRTPAQLRQDLSSSDGFGYASAEELADNICYLASPGASNVVGAVLLSNGGRFTV